MCLKKSHIVLPMTLIHNHDLVNANLYSTIPSFVMWKEYTNPNISKFVVSWGKITQLS